MEKDGFDSEQIGANNADKTLERDQPKVESRLNATIMKQFSDPLKEAQIARAMEKFYLLNDNPAKRAMERIYSFKNTSAARAMEQIYSLKDTPAVRAMEQIYSLKNTPAARAMEQFHSFKNTPAARAMEQLHSLKDTQIARAMEQFYSFKDSQIARAMEQLYFPLKNTQLRNLFSYFEGGSILGGASVEALLNELEGRRTDFPDEFGSGFKNTPQHIEGGGNVTVSVIAVGDARVEKVETGNLPGKTQDLSAIPTWFLLLALNLLLTSITLIGQWEQIRTSIVDMNARLPQSESFFEIRNFIRTNLAGKPGDIRLVKGSSVNLREDPSMKSAVILMLPENAPVVVYGKEDRTWLLVSYEHQGYWIDGYVSTKHLKKARKY